MLCKKQKQTLPPGRRLRLWRERENMLPSLATQLFELTAHELSLIERGLQRLPVEKWDALVKVGVPEKLATALMTQRLCQHNSLQYERCWWLEKSMYGYTFRIMTVRSCRLCGQFMGRTNQR